MGSLLEGDLVSPIGIARPATEELWVDPELRAAGQTHLQDVLRRSPQMHDGRVLAATTIHGIDLEYGQGRYFDAIATTDSLCAEYLLSASSNGDPADGDPTGLPLRALAHRASGGDPLHCGRGRIAAIGVTLAVTLPLGPTRTVVLGRRSLGVATDPGLWHLAPSGTLEPAPGDVVIALLLAELSEELGIELPPERLANRLRTMGLSHDLLRLRPEICLRLDLEPGEYPAGGPELSPQEFQAKDMLELSSAGMEHFWSTHPPATLTPAAAGALALLENDEGLRPLGQSPLTGEAP
jgi:hypothetical protein